MEQFWSESPNQFIKRVKMFEKTEKERIKEMDTMNFYLGKYIGFAVNDPKKYPDQPFMYEEDRMSVEAMQSMAQSITEKVKNQNKIRDQSSGTNN